MAKELVMLYHNCVLFNRIQYQAYDEEMILTGENRIADGWYRNFRQNRKQNSRL